MKESSKNIPYNKPYITRKALAYVNEVFHTGTVSGGGKFTRLCHHLFTQKFGFTHCYLTASCSAALDMTALLCELEPGDEVIVPSFGYVTMASLFHTHGARLVFADSEKDSPHICPNSIKNNISKRTKVLVIVHYAGVSCNMEEIQKIVEQHHLILIEDCAQAINAKYKNQYLGSFGHLSTFSFHETKNIHCGEGGLLVVNDDQLSQKAIQVWQEGTNRADFEKGFVKQYEWVTLGSSYQPSEMNAAFLYAQMKYLDTLHEKRLSQWMHYYKALVSEERNGLIQLPPTPHEGHNGHIFYLQCSSRTLRDEMIAYLNSKKIMAVFHYFPLHLSPFWLQSNEKKKLKNVEVWSGCILRLPLYFSLTENEQDYIIQAIKDFLYKRKPGV